MGCDGAPDTPRPGRRPLPPGGARPHPGQLRAAGGGDVAVHRGHAGGAVRRSPALQTLLGGAPALQQVHALGTPTPPGPACPHPRSPLLACPSSSGPWKKQRRPPRPTWTTAPTRYKVRGPRGPQHPAAPDCPPPRRAPPLGPLPAPSGRLTVCLSVSPTRLGAVRVRLISVSLTPRRRCAQARAESE